MFIEIAEIILIIALIGVSIYNVKRLEKTEKRLISLALEVAGTKETIDRVDSSTGSDIFRLRKEFEDFKEEYGDAAIDEMKENARKEKAWADGINNIMSYGSDVYGSGLRVRGDST